MKKTVFIVSLLALTFILIIKEHRLEKPAGRYSEGCVVCHKEVTDPDPSHPISAFGCYSCHLGNPYSLDRERAHASMVKNPGDLRVADRSCGGPECHPEIVPRVKNSLMATNRGILKTIQGQWPGKDEEGMDVQSLLSPNPAENLAIDHYRKMCGGCHLWKERGDLPGEKGLRGGGCTDCHILDGSQGEKSETMTSYTHARITTKIPSENCVKCHNRSARIGLSYFGRFESEGYGTPYEAGGFSSRQLSGNRFYLQLPADVHHAEAEMTCVDCHTGTGLMGDGKAYERMEDQTDITCEACHDPRFEKVAENDSLAVRLAFLNREVPEVLGRQVALSRKGTPLYNVQRIGDKVIFFSKQDGRATEMDISSMEKPHHRMNGHDRLSCQACHSAWMPQCYGCHLDFRKAEVQRDWFTREERSGLWRESRSYIRFSKPGLGLENDSTISPFSPCQVFVNFFDEKDEYRPEQSFKVFTFSSFDPHTTVKESRTCKDCHGDPKSLGLGEGRLYREGRDGGEWRFRATYDAASSGLGVSFPLDAFVDLTGKPLQRTSRREARPFNQEELRKIMRVDDCAGCHDKYEDPIYTDFDASYQIFLEEPGVPCKRPLSGG